MNDLSPAALAQAPVAPASAILVAAGLLLPSLERGQRVDSAMLRAAMETAFGASDASGLWDWKAGYDACEAATVLFLRKYGRALFRQADRLGAAGSAVEDRRPPAHPHAPLRGKPGASAVFHADAAWASRR